MHSPVLCLYGILRIQVHSPPTTAGSRIEQETGRRRVRERPDRESVALNVEGSPYRDETWPQRTSWVGHKRLLHVLLRQTEYNHAAKYRQRQDDILTTVDMAVVVLVAL